MREYTVREGSMYSGTHFIYENEEEFQSKVSVSGVKLNKWAIDDFRKYQVGDYIEAEDGYKHRFFPLKR